eukprot:700327-Prymnesium_polylepis.1
MRSVLARLARVTADEAATKHAAMRRVRDAFVWREPTSWPSAVDHILSAACTAAKRIRSSTPQSNERASVETEEKNATGTSCILD